MATKAFEYTPSLSNAHVLQSFAVRSNTEPRRDAGQFSILLIDDNPTDLRVMRLGLKWTRFSVPVSLNVVEDCESALNALRQGTAPLPNIIILDLERQGKPCLRALQNLKENERTRPIPVIAMARHGYDSLTEAYAAYANCVVQKPETVEQAEALFTRLERFWFSAAILPCAAR